MVRLLSNTWFIGGRSEDATAGSPVPTAGLASSGKHPAPVAPAVVSPLARARRQSVPLPSSVPMPGRHATRVAAAEVVRTIEPISTTSKLQKRGPPIKQRKKLVRKSVVKPATSSDDDDDSSGDDLAVLATALAGAGLSAVGKTSAKVARAVKPAFKPPAPAVVQRGAKSKATATATAVGLGSQPPAGRVDAAAAGGRSGSAGSIRHGAAAAPARASTRATGASATDDYLGHSPDRALVSARFAVHRSHFSFWCLPQNTDASIATSFWCLPHNTGASIAPLILLFAS
jgi:hypothetical protein